MRAMTTRIVAIAIVLAAGCGSKKEPAEEKTETQAGVVPEAKEGAKDKLAGGLAALRDKATAAKDELEAAKAKVEAAKGEVTMKAFDAALAAMKAKKEIDKLDKMGDYDFAISSVLVDSAGMKDHEAKMASMPHVTVGDITVGYEEDPVKTLNGTEYKHHFRATYVHMGMKVGFSYYTKGDLDGAGFATLITKFLPIVRMSVGG